MFNVAVRLIGCIKNHSNRILAMLATYHNTFRQFSLVQNFPLDSFCRDFCHPQNHPRSSGHVFTHVREEGLSGSFTGTSIFWEPRDFHAEDAAAIHLSTYQTSSKT